MTLDPWRAYCAAQPVRDNRLQSLAFLSGEGLEPKPLRPGQKFFGPELKAQSLSTWTYLDRLPFENWGAGLQKEWVDIDADVRPVPGSPAATTRAQGQAILTSIHNAFEATGFECRSFGRISYNGRGHWVAKVAVPKGEVERLRRLQMAQPVRCGAVTVRIEVRRPTEHPTKGETLKTFTLPGSVYREATGALDLITWNPLGAFKDGETMPPMAPNPIERLILSLYAAMLALAVAPHWERGARHGLAIQTAGVLAHEFQAGMFDEDECKLIFEHVLAEVTDDEKPDRRKCLADSLQAVTAHRPVTGYRTLAETIGDDWKAALLRLRGGGDPDALGVLFENLVRLRYGLNHKDCYIDLSMGAGKYAELDTAAARFRFSNRREFPSTTDSKGKRLELIEIVMRSSKLRTYDKAVTFPGIPFGVCYFWDSAHQEYTEITPETAVPEGAETVINVAAGFPTRELEPGAAPPLAVYQEALRLWHRLRGHLTSVEPEKAGQLDQVIARKLQKVREKYPIGCALVGGQGIGKSFLFDGMLSALIGDNLIRKSTTSELKSEFRFTGIEKVLFYFIEECRFDQLPVEVLQMLKDIMRNRRTFRNTKYGVMGETSNVCVPFFLSNEANPKLSFDGRPDRALLVIRGDSQETFNGVTLLDWEDHKQTIARECGEFAEALHRVEIREALLHYFLTLELDEELGRGNESANADDLRNALSHPLAALVEILESGYILPERRGDRGPTITEPFTMGTLLQGLRERLRLRNASTTTMSSRGAGLLVSELFLERKHRTAPSRDVAREAREDKVLRMARLSYDGEQHPLYYFGFQRGRLLHMLKERRGLDLEPSYSLNGAEMGENPPPTKEMMRAAYVFATENTDERWNKGLS